MPAEQVETIKSCYKELLEKYKDLERFKKYFKGTSLKLID